MLSEAEADLLARRAGQLRGDGSRASRAQRAWERLCAAGDVGDDRAVEAVLRAWLRRPDEESWELLCRWLGAEVLAERACAAAADPGRFRQERARLGEFCARRGLAPAGEADRVLFYAMAGQHGQRRAADPDGSLLAAAYRAAPEPVRAALREALAGAGDLDHARLLAAGGDRVPLLDEEVSYLVGQLAAQADWERLWRVALDLPLAAAIAAARRIGDSWRPVGERDRELLRLLRRADPDRVTAGRAALAKTGSIRVKTPPGKVRTGALSDDGWRLAVVTPDPSSQPPPAWLRHGMLPSSLISEFDVPSGTMTGQCESGPEENVRLYYSVGELIACRIGELYDPGYSVLREEDGRLVPLVRHHFSGWLAAVDGIVPLPAPSGGLALLRGGVLMLRSDDNGFEARAHVPYGGPRTVVAADPGGLLAFADANGLAVYDASDPWQPRLVAGTSPLGFSPTGACFAAPGYLVLTGIEEIRLWRFADGAIDVVCTVTPRGAPRTPAVVPGHGAVAVRIGDEVSFIDATSLDPLPAPAGFPAGEAFGLWNSPDHTRWAIGREGAVDVLAGPHPALAAADRPMSAWTPGDLAAVAAQAVPFGARLFVALLRGCLELKVGMDVAIGAATPAFGEDDIGLAPAGGE